MDLLAALDASDAARAVRTSTVLYASTSALHVLSIGTLLGSILLYDLSILRGTTAEQAAVLTGARTAAAIGLIATLLTGLVLFACRALTYVENPIFQLKLAVISIAAMNVLLFHRLPSQAALLRKASALFSGATWIAALFLGRWIAFS